MMILDNMTSNSTNPDPDDAIAAYRIVLAVLFSICIVLTLFGNALVFLAICFEKRLRTVFNFYIANLAITDFSVGVTGMPFYTLTVVLQTWPLGEGLCAVWIFFDYALTFASIFTLVVISVDRVWAVTWSVHYRTQHNGKKAIIALIALWFLVLAIWIPPWIVDRLEWSQESDECVWKPERNRVFAVVVALVGYHGTCIVMIVCYVKVLTTLREQQNFRERLRVRKGTESTSSIDTAIANEYIHLMRTDGPAAQGEESEMKSSCDELNFLPLNKDDTEERDPSKIAMISSCGTSAASNEALDDEITMNNSDIKKTISIPVIPNKARGIYTQKGVRSFPSTSTLPPTVDGPATPRMVKPMVKQTSKISLYYNKFASEPERVYRKIKSIKRKFKDEINDQNRKVFATLTVVIICYVICWVPFHIIFDITAIEASLVSEWVSITCYWLAYCNSMLNPFLYCCTSPDFRKTFVNILKFKYCRKSQRFLIGQGTVV